MKGARQYSKSKRQKAKEAAAAKVEGRRKKKDVPAVPKPVPGPAVAANMCDGAQSKPRSCMKEEPRVGSGSSSV
eukprot:1618583-Rhodomonas_salina.1